MGKTVTCPESRAYFKLKLRSKKQRGHITFWSIFYDFKIGLILSFTALSCISDLFAMSLNTDGKTGLHQNLVRKQKVSRTSLAELRHAQTFTWAHFL